MTDSNLEGALKQLIDRLVAAAASDAGLRAALREAAERLLAAIADPPVGTSAGAAEVGRAAAPGAMRVLTAAGVSVTPVAGASPTTELTDKDGHTLVPSGLLSLPLPLLGPRVVSAPRDDDEYRPAGRADRTTPEQAGDEVADADLPAVEVRCRMKADGCRWAATRRRRMAEGADFRVEVEPLDREIVERAKRLPDCFLWMNHPTGPAPADPAVLEAAAACFDVTADALAAARAAVADPAGADGQAEQGLALLAEAQSALRAAVAQTGWTGQDKDQLRAYHWLRRTAWSRQVYLPRHMRADDPAAPAGWQDLAGRVQALDASAEDRRQRERRRRSGLNRVRYHLKPVLAAAADDGDDRRHDWQVVIETVDQLVADGLPPSSVELRELLLPVADRVPDLDEFPPGFRLALREVDRFQADRPAPPADSPATAEQTDAVRRVAELLAGRAVVLIGGVPRPHARRALEEAFGLSEVDWVGTREHASIAPFEPHVARPAVAAVLLAIRWSSHSFEGVKAFCDRHGKPLVRLPGGYSPNQVAVQILRQCGGRLGG